MKAQQANNSFVHLRNYSDYSLLQSCNKIGSIIEFCIENKMHSIALTDKGNLFGALEFSIYASKSGIKPIIGCEVDVQYSEIKSSFILLAKDQVGIKNLVFLTSESHKKKHPSITINDLKDRSSGLICLTGDLIPEILTLGQKPNDVINTLLSFFSDRLYIEIRRDIEQPEEELIDVAYSHNIPIVGTNASYFRSPKMHEAHDILLCVSQGVFLGDSKRKHSNPNQYIKTADEMLELFHDLPEAINNSIVISQRCSVMMEEKNPTLPDFPCESKDASQELILRSRSGLQERFVGKEIQAKYLERLEYELRIINQMNYAGYFLIVSDFICWAKNHKIAVGPGRGSGVGSIVAWSLRITEPDPIYFGLIFERFLNPERVSMPDFDIDFCPEKRDIVIKYIQKKYNHVAHIITFGKLQPRAVIRDVGRVLQIPYSKTDEICKMIPHNAVNPITLSEALTLDKNLKKEQQNDNVIEKLIDMSLKLEGIYRHASVHAAGIVISGESLLNSIPLYYEEKSQLPISQYSMKYVEKAGLVKFDLLGLKTLTVINNSCQLITDKFDINSIPLNDIETYKLLGTGQSIGIFQLESDFMKEVLIKLQPDNIDDIIALISLNRPGPMANIPSYINRKHKREKTSYPHDIIKDVLKDTFGVIIYQEQVMEIAQIMGGYNLGEADLLRRAMGKKIKSEMDQQKQVFIEGAANKNIDAKSAEYVFELVSKFAGYGFNKSHAVAYAMISYQTAYLKANYPTQFFVSLMNMDIGNTDKLNILCQDAILQKIQILPPDIKCGNSMFKIEKQLTIRYALGALKNVGLSSIKGEPNDYNNLEDFLENTDINICKKTLESLIASGSLDGINNNRKQLYQSIEKIITHYQLLKQPEQSKQSDLFAEKNIIQMDEMIDWSEDEKSEKEFESFGFYLLRHPLDKYSSLIQACHNKDNFTFGIISNIRIRSSKRGRFAIIKVSNKEDTLTVMCYDQKIIESELMVKKQLVALKYDNRDNLLICKKLFQIEDFLTKHLREIEIIIQNQMDISLTKKALIQFGITNVILRVEKNNHSIDLKLKDKYSIDISFLIKNLNFRTK